MAGAGYKLFNTGDVLLASEVNTYLMQQTVMVFANATARTSALSGVLAEGMLSYLADTNATEVYDGSAWVSVSGTGDITAVTTGANSGLAGGVTTGNADIKINFASKGQLAVGTGSGTTDFLNVGTNGHTLVADSSTATGLKWAAATGGATLLSTTSLSGATTTVSSISQDYTNLYVFVYNFTHNHSSDTYPQIRPNGATSQNYNAGVSDATARGANNDSYYMDAFAALQPSRSNTDQYMSVLYFNYTKTNLGRLPYIQQGSLTTASITRAVNAAGTWYSNSNALTSIGIFCGNSGASWTAGTVEIWGIK